MTIARLGERAKQSNGVIIMRDIVEYLFRNGHYHVKYLCFSIEIIEEAQVGWRSEHGMLSSVASSAWA